MKKHVLVILLILVAVLCAVFFAVQDERPIDFSVQVKPILNKHCISCHGGVKAKGGLSFLFKEDAFAKAESGKSVIIPGDAEHSEFYQRLISDDPELRMPYKKAALTKNEIAILKQWINEGAQWGEHWAYSLPDRVEVPKSFSFAGLFGIKPSGISNDIDYFVQAKLTDKGLSFSPQADKATLLRRLYLDIIGVPPTIAEVEAFVIDNNDYAYERRVDSLLQETGFGEKWATWWLDMARYADSKGYEKDGSRQIWIYRDWVIRALNKDMPYDQFTINQLAGDLLPDPSKDQLIATAFHRNTMNNDESGTDSEEFRVASFLCSVWSLSGLQVLLVSI